ncbi:MAG: hypothetical protein ACRCXT_23095 [Paraclostridium sp.]
MKKLIIKIELELSEYPEDIIEETKKYFEEAFKDKPDEILNHKCEVYIDGE